MTNGKNKSRSKTKNESEIENKCRFQTKDYEDKGYEGKCLEAKGKSKAKKCCRYRSKNKK
jgi:hypothetical protein